MRGKSDKKLRDVIKVTYNNKKVPFWAYDKELVKRKCILDKKKQIHRLAFGVLAPVQNLNLGSIFLDNNDDCEDRGESVMIGEGHIESLSDTSIINNDHYSMSNTLYQNQ